MPFAAFGPGILIFTRTDLTTPVPVNVGYAQELTLDLSGSTKQLFGQNQFPLVAARATIKATGKVKAAEISGQAWNNFFYGQTVTTGASVTWAVGEAQTSSGATPPTVQVTNHTVFNADLGVVYAATGLPLLRVAPGSEATGFYSVNTTTGTYTFAAGDGSTAMLFTYTYTIASGEKLPITNQPIGATPTFQLDYYTSLSQPTPKVLAIRVYACVAAKHSMAFKLEDFMMPEFDFDFFALQNGKVIDYYFPEQS